MMFASLLALLLVQPPAERPSPATRVERIDLGQPLQGSDYLLIAAAARRPELRRADLSCYTIYVYDRAGARRVAFVAERSGMVVRQTEAGTELTFPPPDPTCRSFEFVMDANGGVERVIHSRH